jgi:predicted DNA-binding protein
MDNVFSTRMDKKIISKIDYLTKKLSITKKEFIQKAILFFIKENNFEKDTDILENSFGIWSENKNDYKKIRNKMNKSLERHKR